GQGAAHVVFVASAALDVIVHLVLANIADPKILRGRVAEIEARHAGRRVHGVTLGQLHANVFALHDTEHVFFHNMLGAGRITGCRTNALVLLGNQGFVVQFFIGRISPQVASYTGMHAFRKPFGEAVSQGLKHNAGVVIARIQEGLVMFLDANAPGNGEHADVISHTAGLGCNVVGQTFVIHTLPLLLLLTQVAPRKQYFRARFVGVDFDVVVIHRIGRIKRHHTTGSKPAAFNNLAQHLLAFFIQLARRLAHHVIFQDARKFAEQAPRLEKRRPVDKFGDFSQVVVFKQAATNKLGLGRCVIGPINGRPAGAGVFQADQRRFFAVGMTRTYQFVFVFQLGQPLVGLVRHQCRRHPYRSAGIRYVNDRALVVGRNLDRRVYAASGSTAHQQGD